MVQVPSHSETVSQRPFDLVYSDLRGPSPFASASDLSQHTWIYFISSRSEVLSISLLLSWFTLSSLRLFTIMLYIVLEIVGRFA